MTLRRAAVACALAVAPIGPVAPAPASAAPGQVVRVEHYGASTIPARGPASAPVTVELFFAPSIGMGARMSSFRALEQLQSRHPTRMRIIYRVIKRNAQPPGPLAPMLALEAHAQGKFFEFVAAVQALRQTPGKDQLLEVGKKVGLDPQRLERALSNDRYVDAIEENERRLERLHGTTGPSVFFNDKQPKPFTSMSEADLEAAYKDAYERATDLLDRGIAVRDLGKAFDAELLLGTQPVVVNPSVVDDDPETDGRDPPLANPPLELTGMPTFGEPTRIAEVPIVVLCRPNDNASCPSAMKIARNVERVYRGDVKVVWAPWFDVTRDDAADLTLLADAALCAETIGSSPDDLEASPGWQWVYEQYAQQSRARGRRIKPDTLIDAVATKLHVDQALALGVPRPGREHQPRLDHPCPPRRRDPVPRAGDRRQDLRRTPGRGHDQGPRRGRACPRGPRRGGPGVASAPEIGSTLIPDGAVVRGRDRHRSTAHAQ